LEGSIFQFALRHSANLHRICSILLLAGGMHLHAQQTVALIGPSAPEISSLPAAPLPQPLVTAAQPAKKPPAHPFFDKTNLRLFAIESLAQTGDLITTRRIIAQGGKEADPLARPFVSAGIGGQMVGSYVVGTGGTMLASYLLHRSGHHRLERWTPLFITAIESLATASNIHQLTLQHPSVAYGITPASRAASFPVPLHPVTGSR
jgi:hypothetical protein